MKLLPLLLSASIEEEEQVEQAEAIQKDDKQCNGSSGAGRTIVSTKQQSDRMSG